MDTSMFLSGFLYHGMIKSVFECINQGKINLFVSSILIQEVVNKFKELGADVQAQSEAAFFLEEKGIYIDPKVQVTVCRDPEDNFILELAQEAHADYIVTRDKDLLSLKDQNWKGTKITKPEDFLPILRKMNLIF